MQQSQLDPLPVDLPFRIISSTVGRGAFASIKKAVPLNEPAPVFAVKFIHKAYAVKKGRISPKQIQTEVALHSHVGKQANIIEWWAAGEDAVWQWIAMEYAEGGDLFDKIEADVGVPEDIAHLYFRQLVGGVSFMHSKGVAHRDLKPENILMSASGNLKIADFGMATMFEYKGQRKQSHTTCGSPPYIAPEVLACSRAVKDKDGHALGQGRPPKYDPDAVDIWSCGVILFVLLVGNTPWDEPVPQTSWEFYNYATNNGRSEDPLWARVPTAALSLLRGMMSVDASKRFGFAQIRQHPWFTQPNALLTGDDRISSPVDLAAKMLGNLRITDTRTRDTPSRRTHSLAVDTVDRQATSSTQPEAAPLFDTAYEWERPALVAQSQLAASYNRSARAPSGSARAGISCTMREAVACEPAMSQFSQRPGVPVSMTQAARTFQDLVPRESMARFFSGVPATLLVAMLCDALHKLNVPAPSATTAMVAGHPKRVAYIKVRTTDERRQALYGEIHVDRAAADGLAFEDDGELLDVRFSKVKGDPLEWRRFFKKVAVECSDAIVRPDGDEAGGA